MMNKQILTLKVRPNLPAFSLVKNPVEQAEETNLNGEPFRSNDDSGIEASTEFPDELDESLFLRVGKGDREALSQLVQRYRDVLFGLLVRMTGDRHRADDLFQETFLRAVQGVATFDTGKRFRPWLMAIAVNLVRDDARRRKIRGETHLGELHPDAKSEQLAANQSPAELVEKRDEAEKVQRALTHLTEKERGVILLHFYNGLTLVETAEVLEIPLGTVKSRLHGALQRLKNLLEDGS